MIYLLGLFALFPQVTSACGVDLASADITSIVFVLVAYISGLGVPVYLVLRLLPRYKDKSVSWALQRTVFVVLLLGTVTALYMLHFMRYSTCF